MPFMSQESPVRRAGLSLASLEIKTFACRHEKIREDTGDAKMAAKSMAEEIRMWSNSSFMSGMAEVCLLFLMAFRIIDFGGGTIIQFTLPSVCNLEGNKANTKLRNGCLE